MKFIKMIFVMLVLAGANGCIWWDWGGRGHDREGGDHGDHHEEHR